MTPEASRYIAQANICLSRAGIMLTVSLNEDAARVAYLAAFHVAQAYIFERTGKTSKSHSGVQTEFFRLLKDDVRVDHQLRRFLSQSYGFKTVADYFTGADPTTSGQDAAQAVATARLFLEHFTALVPPASGASRAPPSPGDVKA